MNADLIRAGLGELKSNLVILKGNLVNVITEEIYQADIAFYGSRIAAVGKVEGYIGDNTEIVEADGKYLVPGLIDGHLHPEVSKITVTRFAEAVLPRGTTAIMAILDQTAAVSGIEGVRAYLDEAKGTPLKVFNIPPLKLPITYPVSTARKFGLEEVKEALDWGENAGLCLENEEFLTELDSDVLKVMDLAFSRRLLVHGCSPKSSGAKLASHIGAGIRSDHEMVSAEETLERLRNGMYVIIRETPNARNLSDCIKALTERRINSRRACLCGDDLESRDFMILGHMDHIIRLATEEGMDPIRAIQMGTLNTAEAYRVDHIIGSITPGKAGDVLIVDDLNRFNIEKVFAEGELVAANGKMLKRLKSPEINNAFLRSFNIKAPVTPGEIAIRTDKDAREVEIISMDLSKRIVNRKRKEILSVENGVVKPDVEKDVLYVTVAERHFGTGSKSTGFVSGYHLRSGAMATSLSPEDNNIIVIGTNAEDIAYAINYVAEVKGAQVVVEKGEVVEAINLPIAGIMADIKAEEMAAKEQEIEDAAKNLGCTIGRPFMRMIFLSLTAMPELAITDKGLVDWETRQYISPITMIIK